MTLKIQLGNGEIKELVVLRETDVKPPFVKDYYLSHTKDNLIYDKDAECFIKPRHIEIFESGKVRMWFAFPKGKSWAQTLFPEDVKIIEE